MDNRDILFRREGHLGRITLNRPKALNALTHRMCTAMSDQLRLWKGDSSIAAVAVDAVAGRAFCAGGDIRAISEMGKRRDGSAAQFFADEYRLNAAVKHLGKPYIALIGGIAFGGGVGISIHGSHRVVNENALFAMPETAIGLFPDVGGTYALPRLPGELGMYLALTGTRLGPADMRYAKIATHYVTHARFGEIVQRLSYGEDPDGILLGIAAEPGPPLLASNRPGIDRAFAQDSVEAILQALGEEGEWGRQAQDLLGLRSPTSLKLTYRAMREGRNLDFDSCMRMEYRLTLRALDGHDFYEGVRAAVIDKDQRPIWQPRLLSEVQDADIDRYFASLDVTELSL
jgi:enoyl-CoA hydratase/carnithine racemase